MNYSEYLEIIKEEVEKQLGDDYKVSISKVQKNNGIVLSGILISDAKSNLSPVFYLNDQFNAEKNTEDITIRETVGDIIRVYFDHYPNSQKEVEFFKSYQNMKERILYRLVNYKKNQELLKQIPYKRFHDLAMVFYCDIENGFFENGTILIYNSHLESWNISQEEIYNDAIINTPRQNPAKLQTMADVMQEILEAKIELNYGDNKEVKKLTQEFFAKEYQEIMEKSFMQDKKRYKMYVAGNEQKLYGAAVMLYPDFLKRFAEQIDSDFCIFPSSVHEIILAPVKKDYNPSELLGMVCDINSNQVAPEEVLADSIYYYNRESDSIEIIS